MNIYFLVAIFALCVCMSTPKRSLHVIFINSNISLAKSVLAKFESSSLKEDYYLKPLLILQHSDAFVLRFPRDIIGDGTHSLMPLAFCSFHSAASCLEFVAAEYLNPIDEITEDFVLAIQIISNNDNADIHLKYAHYEGMSDSKKCLIFLENLDRVTNFNKSNEESSGNISFKNFSLEMLELCHFPSENVSKLRLRSPELTDSRLIFPDESNWPVKAKFLSSQGDICRLWWPLPQTEIFILDHRKPFKKSFRIQFRCQFNSLINSNYKGTIIGRIVTNGVEQSVIIDDPFKSETTIGLFLVFENGVGQIDLYFSIEKVDVLESGEIDMQVLAHFDVPIRVVYGSRIREKDLLLTPRMKSQVLSYHTVMTELSREDGFPYLLNSLELTGNAVEIGVRNAQFSLVMLNEWMGNSLLMVDPWFHFDYEDYPDGSNTKQSDQDTDFEGVVNSTQHFGSKSIILRMTSIEAASIILNNSLDFCYIDAQHDYYSLLQDFFAWWPKLRSGGIMAGHDYLEGYTAYYAVQEIGRKLNLPVFVTSGVYGPNREYFSPSWYLFKP